MEASTNGREDSKTLRAVDDFGWNCEDGFGLGFGVGSLIGGGASWSSSRYLIVVNVDTILYYV
jgi:hypothetical protein